MRVWIARTAGSLAVGLLILTAIPNTAGQKFPREEQTMIRKLDARSEERLDNVHPDLARVTRRAIRVSTIRFIVTEGERSEERQIKLFAAGASKIMDSRHIPAIPKNDPDIGPVSHAVDLAAWVDGEIRWDWPLYRQIAQAMKLAALEEDVVIRWGGDWDGDGDTEDESWPDGPHFELPRRLYPTP